MKPQRACPSTFMTASHTDRHDAGKSAVGRHRKPLDFVPTHLRPPCHHLPASRSQPGRHVQHISCFTPTSPPSLGSSPVGHHMPYGPSLSYQRTTVSSRHSRHPAYCTSGSEYPHTRRNHTNMALTRASCALFMRICSAIPFTPCVLKQTNPQMDGQQNLRLRPRCIWCADITPCNPSLENTHYFTMLCSVWMCSLSLQH